MMRKIAYALSLLLIFMIPWEGVIEFPGLGTAARLTGLAMAVLWVGSVVVRGGFRKPGRYHIAFLLFVFWNAVSVVWSADVDRTLALLLTWVQLVGFVFILWDLYTTRAALLTGLQVYVLGTFFAIGNAVANYFGGQPFYTHYQRFSPSDTNPDGFGFILALGIPVAWYLADSWNSTRLGRFLSLVNYAYIPAAFLGLSLSGTRTALIGAVPGMVYGLTSLARSRVSTRVAVAVLFALGLSLFLPFARTLKSFERLGTTGTEMVEGNLQGRLDLWRAGLVSFAEHPIVGVGSNMYRSVNSVGKVAHNSFLSVLVEVGLIGLTLFGIVLTMTLLSAWNQPRWESRFWLCVLVVWAIGASTLSWEYRKPTWLFLSFVVVSAGIRSRSGGDVRAPDESEPVVTVATQGAAW